MPGSRSLPPVWRKLRAFAAMLSFPAVFAAIVLCEAPPALANGPASDEFLKELERQREKIETFSARFAQKKTIAVFDERKISVGALLYKAPCQMLWKYERPDTTQMRITCESVSFYFPELEQIEFYELEAGTTASHMFFAFEAASDEIKKNFDVRVTEQTGPDRIRLVPKSKPLASEVRSITLWLGDDSLPRRIVVDEMTGDSTEITLTDIRVNEPLPDEELQFDAPEGTEVIRAGPGAF